MSNASSARNSEMISHSSGQVHLFDDKADITYVWDRSVSSGGRPSTVGAISTQSPFPSLSNPFAQTVVTEYGMQFPFPSLTYPTMQTSGGSTHSPSVFRMYPSAQI